jgi:predicted site-specific integrase-resolvase
MSRKNCKLCQLLPNAEIENLLATKPSRFVAKELNVSKSLVNNHKLECSGISGSQQIEEKMQ